MRKFGILSSIVGAAALLFAPPAHAEPIDVQFLNDLSRHGIWYTNVQMVISYGRGVCIEMNSGMRRYEIADLVLRDNPAFGNWDNADTFVILANDHYCPWSEPPESPPSPLLPGSLSPPPVNDAAYG